MASRSDVRDGIPPSSVTRIWGQALTVSERSIIERALVDDDVEDLRRWLRFTLTVLDARERMRAAAENEVEQSG